MNREVISQINSKDEKFRKLKLSLKDTDKDYILMYLCDRMILDSAEHISKSILNIQYSSMCKELEEQERKLFAKSEKLLGEMNNHKEDADRKLFFEALSKYEKNEKKYLALNKKWKSIHEKWDSLY